MTKWNYVLRRDGYLILHFYDLKNCMSRVKVLDQLHGSNFNAAAYSAAMSERHHNDVPMHVNWIDLCNLDGSRPPGDLDALWQSRRQAIEQAMQACGETVVLRPNPVDTAVQRMLQRRQQHGRPARALKNSTANVSSTTSLSTSTSASVPPSLVPLAPTAPTITAVLRPTFGGPDVSIRKRKHDAVEDSPSGLEMTARKKRAGSLQAPIPGSSMPQPMHMGDGNSATKAASEQSVSAGSRHSSSGTASSLHAGFGRSAVSNFASTKGSGQAQEIRPKATTNAMTSGMKMSTSSSVRIVSRKSGIGSSQRQVSAANAYTEHEPPGDGTIDPRALMTNPTRGPSIASSRPFKGETADPKQNQEMLEVTLEFEGMGNVEVMIRKVWIPTRFLLENSVDEAGGMWKMDSHGD